MWAEERSDVVFDGVCIAGAGGWTYPREVLRLEPLAQIEDGRRGALVLQVALRVAALVDQLPKSFASARAAVVRQSSAAPMV